MIVQALILGAAASLADPMALYDQALATTDDAARHDLYRQLQELVLEENKDVPNVNALTEREIQIINLIKEGFLLAVHQLNSFI